MTTCADWVATTGETDYIYVDLSIDGVWALKFYPTFQGCLIEQSEIKNMYYATMKNSLSLAWVACLKGKPKLDCYIWAILNLMKIRAIWVYNNVWIWHIEYIPSLYDSYINHNICEHVD